MENDLEEFMKNRKRFWTRFAKVGKPTPYVSAVESASQHLEQQLMIERLSKELDCTLIHRLSPCLGIVIRRNKDDGNVAFLLFQPGLQLYTRHLRHPDVNDQARGPAMQIGFKERFC